MFKNLDNLSKFFYLGTIIPLFFSLVTPLLINSRFLFPFITTKVLYFRILIEIAIFFYFLLIIRRTDLRPRLTKLTSAVLIFFGIITFASIFGVDLYKSFWGNIERGEGLLTVYHVLAFFFLSTQLLKTKKIWFWFLNTTIGVSVLTGFYAMGQMLGWSSILGINIVHTTGSRLASTIGNASFYAGFLLFGIFLSLWLFSKKQQIGWRVFYAAVVLFEVFILIQTETRGGFLGLVGGLLLASFIFVIKAGKTKGRSWAVGLILLLIISAGTIWWQKDSAFVQNTSILNRLVTISINDVTTQSRLLTWDSSWQGLKDQPLLGYGWENYNVAFNKYFHAEIFRDSGSQIWFDRAHNIIFDVAVSSGFLGLIAYLAIFVLAFQALWRHYRNSKDLKSFAFLSSLLVAYFIQNIFVFDVLASYINFYVLLGFIAYLETKPIEPAVSDKGVRSSVLSRLLPAVSMVLIVVLSLAIYYFNIRPMQANLTAVDALIAQRLDQDQESVNFFNQAIDYQTNQTAEIRQKYAEYVIEISAKNFSDQQFLASQYTKAINEVKANIAEHPANVQHYLLLMILYNRSSLFDRNRVNLVIETGEKALELSPTRPQIYYELGQAYSSLRNFDNSIKAFQTAVDLQPEALESHWNLAAAYVLAGRQEKADEEYTWLEEHNFKYYSANNLRRMINVYSNAKKWDRLAGVYEALADLEPSDPMWLAQLAVIYQRLGQIDKARDAVNEAVEIDPSIKAEANLFLQGLEEAVPDEDDSEVLIAE